MSSELESNLKVLTQFISEHNGYIPKTANELVSYSCHRYDLKTLTDLEAISIIDTYNKSLEKVRKHKIQKEDLKGSLGKFNRWWSNSKSSKPSPNLKITRNINNQQIIIKRDHGYYHRNTMRKKMRQQLEQNYDDIYDNDDVDDVDELQEEEEDDDDEEEQEKDEDIKNTKLYMFILLCFIIFMLISTSFIGAIYSNTECNIIWRSYTKTQIDNICNNEYDDKFLKTKNYDPSKTYSGMIIINLLHISVLWMITTLLSLYIYYYSYLKDKEYINKCCIYIGPIIIYGLLWLINIIFTHSVLSDTNLIEKYCNNESKLYQTIVVEQYPFCLYHLIVLYFQIIAVPSIILVIVYYVITKKNL